MLMTMRALGSITFFAALLFCPCVLSAQATRPVQPTLIVDGTVLEIQPGAPRCGTLAVAVWARVRVDNIRTPLGGFIPDELLVMIQCPGSMAVGDRRRFELVHPRPTRGTWTMFSAWPSTPARTPDYWTLRARRLSVPHRRPTR